jgi:ZIP family zinc transporter
MTPTLVIFLTFISTFCGGLFGLKFKSKIKLILGFTAGVLLSVVTFDIFPEIINLISVTHVSPKIPMIALVVGFLVFHILEKSLLIHHSHEDQYVAHKHPSVGILSAIALASHSFLDGLGIGLGFQVSPSVGLIVAIAVIAHDFTDGLNTVSLMLINKNSQKRSLVFLILDSLAPVAGVLFSNFIHLSSIWLLIYLGFFAGFLLYIGASDILPEAHSQKSSYSTIIMTILGVIFIYLITLI